MQLSFGPRRVGPRQGRPQTNCAGPLLSMALAAPFSSGLTRGWSRQARVTSLLSVRCARATEDWGRGNIEHPQRCEKLNARRKNDATGMRSRTPRWLLMGRLLTLRAHRVLARRF